MKSRVIIKTAADDVVVIEAGQDQWVIRGMAGDDTLTLRTDREDLGRGSIIDGGQGNDRLHSNNASFIRLIGGAGDDTVSADDAAYALLEGDAGNDSIRLFFGQGFGNLKGGDGDDRIELQYCVGYNRIEGNAGNDTILIDAAHSWVSGGTGDDTISGGSNNTIRGGEGDDQLDGTNGVLLGGMGDDVITAVAALSGGGGFALADGGQGNDRIYAVSNRDGLVTVRAGAGDDLVTVKSGAVKVMGGAGYDTVQFSRQHSAFYADTNQGSGDYAGTRLFGVEKIIGSQSGDTLRGASGVWLDGGAGDDQVLESAGNHGAETLEGGAGRDVLAGNLSSAGATHFVLSGDDTITGFDRAQGDTLVVRAASIGGIAAAVLSHIDVATSASGHASTASGPQFLWQQDSSQLWFDSDGKGAAAPVLLATIDPALSAIGSGLTAADLHLL
jgi:Ca2+-binding RTX toxin-like protein